MSKRKPTKRRNLRFPKKSTKRTYIKPENDMIDEIVYLGDDTSPRTPKNDGFDEYNSSNVMQILPTNELIALDKELIKNWPQFKGKIINNEMRAYETTYDETTFTIRHITKKTATGKYTVAFQCLLDKDKKFKSLTTTIKKSTDPEYPKGQRIFWTRDKQEIPDDFDIRMLNRRTHSER